MIWFYRILFIPALLLASPYYLYRMVKRGGYRKSFQHRFGLLKAMPPKPANVFRIWIQAVSVGEVRAVAPLIQRLSEDGHYEIVLTTTTSTGYALARETLSDQVKRVAVFPLDFWLFSRRAWQRIQPDAAVLMESELWPEHLHQARRRGCPVLLINARLSDRSYRRYRKLRPLAARLIRQPAWILVSSQNDLDRLLAIGADPVRTTLCGNLKFDTPVGPVLNEDERLQLRQELGLNADTESSETPLVLLGSSTWPGEEALLLETLMAAREQGLAVKLLIVPRHAERRAEIRSVLNGAPLRVHFRHGNPPPEAPVDVAVADTTGELTRLSQVADLVFIGKSLPPNQGGQTPIEAAALGLPIIYGPNMTNFRDVTRSLERNSAALRVEDAEAARAELLRLLADAKGRASLGQRARDWHASNRGALGRALAAIYELHR